MTVLVILAVVFAAVVLALFLGVPVRVAWFLLRVMR